MAQTERENLIKLLDYFINHNAEHKAEFLEWAAKTESYSGGSVAMCLKEAAKNMETANQFLSKALKDLKK